MYLARKNTPDGIHFIVRRSVPSGGIYLSQDLIDLGPDPAQCIVYNGELSYTIAEHILDRLEQLGVDTDAEELEELLLPFVDPYIQQKAERFRYRYAYRKWQPMSPKQREEVLEKSHVFDRRRVHYLRFGHSSDEILNASPPLFKGLLNKSRDEIEQWLSREENALQPREYRRYLFTIFDLQRYFSHLLSRSMAHALDPKAVDERFVEAFCHLNSDTQFWAGYKRNDRIPELLLRYLFLFFDHAQEDGDLLFNTSFNRLGRQYRQRRAYRQAPAQSKQMSMGDAVAIFSLSKEQFAQMSHKELTALYRKKAQTVHPDKGGNHDEFVRLTEAYNELRRMLHG